MRMSNIVFSFCQRRYELGKFCQTCVPLHFCALTAVQRNLVHVKLPFDFLVSRREKLYEFNHIARRAVKQDGSMSLYRQSNFC
jgi:hypothetical protein